DRTLYALDWTYGSRNRWKQARDDLRRMTDSINNPNRGQPQDHGGTHICNHDEVMSSVCQPSEGTHVSKDLCMHRMISLNLRTAGVNSSHHTSY
ncbi:hypothetical protein AVEN_11200-1, partial [Araneus ventricosus]